MNQNYVIALSRRAYPEFGHSLPNLTGSNHFTFIEQKSELTLEYLQRLRPRYVFFPHWSYIIPSTIFNEFECIIFHMTDVPFGRGGSPLQNLISRGIYETKISALRCEQELDSGPVYMKRPLSLHGTAQEIYIRAARQIEGMIAEIVNNEPLSQPQQGEIVNFARRKPSDSNIAELSSLLQTFDYIRMLDADGYPKAFLETDYLRFEFSRASYTSTEIVADVRITRK
jgi:methionyl-tRNA formyltransferase